MFALLLFAIPAALAFAGVYRVAERAARDTLRFAGAATLWTLFIVLLITWS